MALIAWHRWAGIVALTGVLLWAASGTLHPIMARLQPAPAAQVVAAEAPLGVDGLSLSSVLARHGMRALADARVVLVDGVAHYQVTLPEAVERVYYALADGSRALDGDRRYAQALARRHLGDAVAPIASARLQTRFDGEYADVNRLLPVWRVEFERADRMRVFVDTRTDRLGTLVDIFKAFSSAEFGNLHRWDWLDSIAPRLRLAVMATLLVAALGATLGGLWLYFARRKVRGRLALRRIHRALGVAVSIFALAFFASGLYHLLHIGLRGDPAARAGVPATRIDPARLAIGFSEAAQRAGIAAPARISIAEIEGVPYYRVQRRVEPRAAAAHHADGAPEATTLSPATRAEPVYVSASDGSLLAGGEQRYAASIVKHALGSDGGGAIVPIMGFAGEYGFVFKRLPVQRVLLADSENSVAYVDTADGSIAALIDDADRREGWIFANVHKHDWLVPWVGRATRDAIAATAAVMVALTASMGAVLFYRSIRARPAPAAAAAGSGGAAF